MRVLDGGMKLERLAHYRSVVGSQYHCDKYKRWNKVLAHRVECRILRQMLRRTGHSQEILDAPCGTGRFLPVVALYADRLCLGDISPCMLDVARHQAHDGAVSFAQIDLRSVASGNRTFEGVLSIRLTHHIYEERVLDDYFLSLSRLARRWVILTFRDAHAPRTISRRWMRRILSKDHLPAQTLDEISEAMGAHGFRLITSAHVSRWFSGHRYALFVRSPDS